MPECPSSSHPTDIICFQNGIDLDETVTLLLSLYESMREKQQSKAFRLHDARRVDQGKDDHLFAGYRAYVMVHAQHLIACASWPLLAPISAVSARLSMATLSSRSSISTVAGFPPAGSLELGSHDLSAGPHRLRFTAIGKNATSTNFFFDLDAVDLLAAK
jgi:hypothetical protein